MDFKDFCDIEIKQKKVQEKIKFSSNEEQIKQQAFDTINKYSNYSNNELMNELVKKTNEKKKDGSLSPEKMEQIYNSIYSVLPPENRKNLEDIFNRLR